MNSQSFDFMFFKITRVKLYTIDITVSILEMPKAGKVSFKTFLLKVVLIVVAGNRFFLGWTISRDFTFDRNASQIFVGLDNNCLLCSISVPDLVAIIERMFSKLVLA